MRAYIGFVAVTSLFLGMSATAVQALEPDPPRSLISAKEAVAITIRQRLHRAPAKTTQLIEQERAGVAKFYTRENARPVWVTESAVTTKARRTLDEIRNADRWGLDVADFDLPAPELLTRQDLTVSDLIEIELKTSLAVARYARHARGGKYDPFDLSDDIDRPLDFPKPAEAITAVLNADDPAQTLIGYHPTHEQFRRLRLAYVKALGDEQNPNAGNDAAEHSRSNRSKRRRKAMKLSTKLRYNMELWRWMPRDLGRMHIIANVPEFKFRVVDGGRVIHEERVITGKVKNKTPIFSDEMEKIVLNPNWNVPNSIKVKELLPGLLDGRDTLSRKGLVLEDWHGNQLDPFEINWIEEDIRKFRVYQPPSRGNALGQMKFMFPNKHAVYMHDTPTKHLFKRSTRAFSHGCIRVRNPLEFATLILGRDKGWTRGDIQARIRRGENEQIELTTRIPVHIAYFTAHVNADGEVSQFDDIYGFERLIQKGLDGKAHLFVKPKRDLNTDLERIVGTSRSRGSYRTSYDDSSFWYGGGGNTYSSNKKRPQWMRRAWRRD